jgi:hypothetical protein
MPMLQKVMIYTITSDFVHPTIDKYLSSSKVLQVDLD